MSQTTLSPPFIGNAFDSFVAKLTLGRPEAANPQDVLVAYQAFYAGYASACGLLTAVSGADLKFLTDAIKAELNAFSAASREMGKKMGVGHVRVPADPSRPGLHVQDGGKA